MPSIKRVHLRSACGVAGAGAARRASTRARATRDAALALQGGLARANAPSSKPSATKRPLGSLAAYCTGEASSSVKARMWEWPCVCALLAAQLPPSCRQAAAQPPSPLPRCAVPHERPAPVHAGAAMATRRAFWGWVHPKQAARERTTAAQTRAPRASRSRLGSATLAAWRSAGGPRRACEPAHILVVVVCAPLLARPRPLPRVAWPSRPPDGKWTATLANVTLSVCDQH